MGKETYNGPPYPQTGVEGNNRGTETETHVASILESLPPVASIQRTEQHSEDDKNGYDMFVNFHEGHYLLDRVGVQVKSSQPWVHRFRRDLRRRHNLQGDELDSWLLANKLIIINGRKTEEEVVTYFYEQLNRMSEYQNPPQEIQIFPQS